MENKDREKVIKFLGNQLLKEVTLEQTIAYVKSQAVKQATETFDKMSEAEKSSLLEKIIEQENKVNSNE